VGLHSYRAQGNDGWLMRSGLNDRRSSRGILLAEAVLPFLSCPAASIGRDSAVGCSTSLATRVGREVHTWRICRVRSRHALLRQSSPPAPCSLGGHRPRRVGAEVDGGSGSCVQVGQATGRLVNLPSQNRCAICIWATVTVSGDTP